MGRAPKPNEPEVIDLLRRCAGEFKDVRLDLEVEGRSLEYPIGELATPMLFAFEHLRDGKPAPEIVGNDVDGKPFKLSDYRGKVVVVDSFSDWCPFCVRMYPEERELTRKLAGKPFAMPGVNCDSTDTLRQILADQKVTWRCWSDGKQGPIATKWQLDGYPLMFVLDHDGVIRHRFDGMTQPRALEQAVTPLIKADGRRVLTGGDTRVILWDADTGAPIRRLEGHSTLISSASFLPDGRRAVSSSFDRSIRLWDLETGKEIHRFEGHPREVTWSAVSPDARLAAWPGTGGTLIV